MDRKLERKFWDRKRIISWSGIAFFIVAVTFVVFRAIGFTPQVDGQRITISEVQYRGFSEVIPVSGTVEPIKTVNVDAVEGGVVEEVFVEDGATVVEGQILIRLSNTALSLDFMNRETQIIEQINNLRSTRIALLQNQRQTEDQMLDVENQLLLIEKQFQVDTQLATQKAISDIELFNSTRSHELANKRFRIMKKRVAEDELYRRKQLSRIDASIDLMERNLEAIRKNLENLLVKAPISGQLNSFDLEIGETKSRGQHIARIDQLDAFKVSASIDQYYLNKLRVGQSAQCDYGGKAYQLMVVKVSPTINAGQFEAELEFKDQLPPKLTRGQMFQLRISLSATADAYVIPKGAFYQSTGGEWVFVLDDEHYARKRTIELGRQNTDYIEVLSGLEEGERIITSTYDGFKEHEQIQIKTQ